MELIRYTVDWKLTRQNFLKIVLAKCTKYCEDFSLCCRTIHDTGTMWQNCSQKTCRDVTTCRYRWENNIKMDIKERGCECGLKPAGSE